MFPTLIALVALASLPAQGPSSATDATPGAFTFETPTLVCWRGRTQVLAFHAREGADEDRRPEVRVDDPALLEVVAAPEVLAGRKVGFLRVLAREPGTTTLRVGDAELTVHIQETGQPAELHRGRLVITSPVPSACVWGTIAVGVEARGLAAARLDPQDVWLELSGAGLEDELTMAPARVHPRHLGPDCRLVFELTTGKLSAGEYTLVAHAELAGERLRSTPTSLCVVHPEGEALTITECEDLFELERPAEFGEDPPAAGSHPDASGGAYAALVRYDPAWIQPLTITTPGRYQALVRARGDFAVGAFPSIGFGLDAPADYRTAGRLVDTGWHRVPIGVPIEIEEGETTCVLRFLNDESLSGTIDRNLYLDRFELLRIDAPDGPIEASLGSMMALSTASMVTGNMSMTMAGAGEDGEPQGFGSGGLSIAFERPLEGLAVNGRLVIRGFCRWDARSSVPAPRVDLLLNGEVVDHQQGAEPTFGLDRRALAPGENRIQLAARLDDGRSARTPVQTLVVNEPTERGYLRRLHRFEVLDDHWDDSVRAMLSEEGREPGHAFARMLPGSEVELHVPDRITGEHDLFLHVRSPGSPRAGELEVVLKTAEGETRIGEASVQGHWNNRPAGTVTLGEGPRSLVVRRPPAPEAGAEAARIQLRALLLREHDPRPDRRPPRARLAYPHEGHEAHGVDAAVVEAWDDDRIERADVLIDGSPQGTLGFIPDGAGHLVLPLILRELSPGEHTLSVRVRDTSGNVGDTREIGFTVLDEAPAERGRYARAIHLLNRFAYGMEPRELAKLLTSDEESWLRENLSDFGPGDQAALGAAEARMHDAFNYFVSRAAIIHAIRSDNPVRTRFAFWLENHFSTWIGKTQGPAEWHEHKTFLRMGPAPFGELLVASATSSAMLSYLDQERSYAARLNENYAREIMELHTLGVHGGYTQDEVTSLARLLAGLTFSQEALPNGQGGYQRRVLRYDPALGDGREHEILGVRFREAAADERFDRIHHVLEVLAAHPSTARYVCGELARHYTSVPPPEGLVDDLARVFVESGGDMERVLLSLARHPAFWEADEPRITNPFEFALRVARASDAHEVDWAVHGYLERSGMGMFDRSTPDGFPEEDAAWVDTNGLLQRMRLSKDVPWALRRLVPDRAKAPPAGDPRRWAQRIIDIAAVRFTGALLGEDSNAAALEFAGLQEGKAWQVANELALFVTRLPEANLR